MKRKRQNHGLAYKAKVALAALQGGKTLAELAAQFEVHATHIQQRIVLLLPFSKKVSPVLAVKKSR